MADDTQGMQPAAMAPPDQGGGGVGSFVQGFANSFGQGLQSAGAILSPQVYKTQAIERQNALTNLLTGLKVSKERIAMQADQQVVAALKESGLQPGMTSQAQMDALSKIDPAILAQSGLGQQVLGEVYKKHQMEIQTGQQNLQLQNAQRLLNQQQMELNKPTEHFDAASGKLVRSYRDGRVETIDAAPPHAQRTTINVGNDMVQDAMVDKNGNVIKTLGEPSHKFAKSVAPVVKIGGDTEDTKLQPDELKFMARQAWTGDTSVWQNIGRGKQGAANIVALRREVMKEGELQGKTPEDLARMNAEFQGIKAGERTLGTRQANVDMAVAEAQNMIPLALKASEELKRTNVKSVNDLIQYAQGKTSSPELRRLAGSTNALVNIYARAVSPSGTPTVSDKDHAREVLDKGFSDGDYKAAVDQLMLEMGAAEKSPAQVRARMGEAISPKPVTATGPNGQKLILKDGKWQPMQQ